MPSRPVLAFTCGDPAGVGPEIVVKALRASRLRRAIEPVLVGELSVWRRGGWKPDLAPIVDTRLGLRPPAYGRPSGGSGRIAFAALEAACRLASRRLVAGIVTAPISKEAWALAGVPFRDHTEYLRELTGADAEMILAAPAQGLWSVLVTRHMPLREVPRGLSAAGVVNAARKLNAALRSLGRSRPKLALCGLNPHAGEGGLLGVEERRVLAPALRAARRAGLSLEGPVAADAAWRLHRAGRYDGLVCLYHDQALIALKTAAGLGIVNWTAGLPFIRTSPGHGTAFDIAGKRAAAPSAMEEAALLAARLSA